MRASVVRAAVAMMATLLGGVLLAGPASAQDGVSITCVATNTGDHYYVAWDHSPSDQIDRFVIERKVGNWYWRGRVPAGELSFFDERNREAEAHRVSALDADGNVLGQEVCIDDEVVFTNTVLDCEVWSTADGFRLTWDGNFDPLDGYRAVVERHTTAWYWRMAVPLPSGDVFDGPSPTGRSTEYRITVKDSSGDVVDVVPCQTFVPEAVVCDAAFDGEQFNVTWFSDVTGIDRFVVERQTSDWWWRGRTGPDARSFTDSPSPVGPDTPYRVSALDAAGRTIVTGTCA